jgi:amidase
VAGTVLRRRGAEAVAWQGPARVSVVTDSGGLATDPVVAGALDRAARLLADAGYVVAEDQPPALERAGEIYHQIMSGYSRALEQQPPVETVAPGSWHAWMRQAPLVLAPVCARPAFVVGSDLDPDWQAGWPAAMRITVAVSLLGLPLTPIDPRATGARAALSVSPPGARRCRAAGRPR